MDSESLLNLLIENGIIDLSTVGDGKVMTRTEKMVKTVHKSSIAKGKDGRWRTRISEGGTTRQIAKTSRADLMEALYQHYFEKEDVSFEGMFNRFKDYKEQLTSPNTIVKYECDYKRFFEGTDFSRTAIDQITSEDCEIFIVNRIKYRKLIKRTYDAMWNYMRGTFRYAKNKRYITENPMDFLNKADYTRYCRVKSVKASDRVISDREFELLTEVIDRDIETKPDFITVYALKLAGLTGMRVGELAALRWDAIDREAGIIAIDKAEILNQKTKEYSIEGTKNGKERFLPITDEIENLLNRIHDVEEEYGFLCDWVFANKTGRIHKKAMVCCARSKSKQAGIKCKSIHSYRRTINSHMRSNGVSATVAASMLGHLAEVNEQNYTYDISDLEYKREALSRAQRKV